MMMCLSLWVGWSYVLHDSGERTARLLIIYAVYDESNAVNLYRVDELTSLIDFDDGLIWL